MLHSCVFTVERDRKNGLNEEREKITLFHYFMVFILAVCMHGA